MVQKLPDHILHNLPRHLAIIMDGNGRWAKKRFLPRIMGHRQGAKTVKEIVTAARRWGIRYLTLYAFSKENWSRPKEEVDALMDLLSEYLQRELDELLGNKIRLRAIGDIEDLPPRVRTILFDTMNRTSKNYEMQLILALSYGGRAEIARAAKRLSLDVLQGKLRPDDVNKNTFKSYLYTSDVPDPDLIIRTSGEMRLSNFLLYQAAYSELYITDTLWPDFNENELLKALEDYSRRERRFGKTSEQIVLKCTGNES